MRPVVSWRQRKHHFTQSMVNEYFLFELIDFQDRDCAYDFIKNYTTTMAKAFLIREAVNNSAIN